MNASGLAAVAGTILTLSFSYVPGLKDWYETQDGNVKRLIMLGLLVVVALGSFGLACANLAGDFGVTVTCDQAGVVGLVNALIAAVVANQAVYAITPKSKDDDDEHAEDWVKDQKDREKQVRKHK